jgi:predicted lactoylglutathione lyase
VAVTSNHIFVNLPVKDLKKTNEFFTKVGFAFNAQFSNDNATCMVVSDSIFVMLLTETYFSTFTKRPIADASKSTEVIVALSAESRDQVDELVDRALAAGGQVSNETTDHGFMYVRSFSDLDGHMWEIVYMDMAAANQG